MTKTVTKNKVRSVEPLIADLANGWMKSYNLDYKLEQEPLNTEIDKALDEYLSKSGGKGGNRPDAFGINGTAGKYMSMPSDANKSNGDNNNTVAAREYRQLKFFELTKPSP